MLYKKSSFDYKSNKNLDKKALANSPSPFQIIRQLVNLDKNIVSDIFSSLPYLYFQDYPFPEDKVERLRYLRELKNLSPEIYVNLIWRVKDYLEGIRVEQNTELPPIKPYLKCLQTAAQKLGLETKYDNYRGELEVQIDSQSENQTKKDMPLLFINGKTPFNNQIVFDLCKDKERSYNRIKEVIKTPKTIGFLDPACKPEHQPYLIASNQEQIVNKILEWTKLPLIVKQNRGSQGKNVFLCKCESEIKNAISTIFDRSSKDYDYMLLAQEYIDIETEYRVVVFDGKIELVYAKDTQNVVSLESFVNVSSIIETGGIENKASSVLDVTNETELGVVNKNISPLHQEGARAVHIEDRKTVEDLQTFISPIFNKVDLVYGGLDVAKDKNGELWVIELNTNPIYNYFLTDNPPQILEAMYSRILSRYLEKRVRLLKI